MDWLENVIIEDKESENERLDLTDKNSLYFLGPNLSLRNCALTVKVSARNLIIIGARFIDCSIDVKQELRNHQQWVKASLEGSRISGRLTGCDFGYWPEYGSDPGYQLGSVENCDFSGARMDGCRIMGSDPSTIRFPKWPCFTILDPIGRTSELRGLTWPGPLGELIRDMLPKHPPRTRALTYYAPSAARLVETTPEEIRAVIEKFDGILY